MSQPDDGEQPPSTSYEPPNPAPGAYPPAGQYPAPQPYGQGPTGLAMSPAEEQNWCVAAHLSGLVASFVVLPFLGPLLVLLIAGGRSPRVRRNAVEALNFSISALIYGLVSFVLLIILVGFVLLPAVAIGYLVLSILAAVAASQGTDYRYPLTLRLVH